MAALPRFSEFRVEDVEPELDALLARARSEIERVAATRDPDWNSFVQPLEDIDDSIERFWGPVSHLHAVADSEALRQVYEVCLDTLTRFQTEIAQDARLYAGFKTIAGQRTFSLLTDAQRKVVENALRDFRLAGVDLEDAAKRRFRELSESLARLANRFERNLLDSTQGWHLHLTDESDLAGLPPSTRELAHQQAAQAGLDGWKFTLDAPSYLPFMTFADSGSLRRAMYEAYVTRASELGPNAGRWDNGSLMVDILAHRQELAALVGYEDYVAYSLATKMAESAAEVGEFLNRLAERALPAARCELADLRQFAKERFGVGELEAWDLPYYAERLRQARFNFSQEDLRPYFPLPRVLDGMFEVAARLFGIRVRERAADQVWHDDVRLFEITDAGGDACGVFYADMYARKGKRGGAWMADCVTRRRRPDGSIQQPVAFLTCNFSPPVGERPSLLTHEDVITLFHEFGHILHHLLTRVDHVAVAGIHGVKWDAVELPSQFLENWCWERDALDLISGHVDNGQPLPHSLLDKMRAARNFQAAMQMLRQVEFSLFDLRIHRHPPPAGTDAIQACVDQVRSEVAVVRPPPFNRFQHSFGHIFGGGYAAGYYSYKWAEVLSADAFGLFEENGIFDRATGESFLHQILETGGVKEPAAQFTAFRGRAATVDALLRHTGLIPEPSVDAMSARAT